MTRRGSPVRRVYPILPRLTVIFAIVGAITWPALDSESIWRLLVMIPPAACAVLTVLMWLGMHDSDRIVMRCVVCGHWESWSAKAVRELLANNQETATRCENCGANITETMRLSSWGQSYAKGRAYNEAQEAIRAAMKESGDAN